MKKRFVYISLGVVLLALASVFVLSRGSGSSVMSQESTHTPQTVLATASPHDSATTSNMPVNPNLKRLVDAYPDFLELDTDATNSILWKADNSRMPFDDGVKGKTLDQMLDKPDLEDQMAMQYERGNRIFVPKDFDPGRVRYETFFKKMYGGTEAEVKANLVTVYWLPHHGNQPLLVTQVNGVSVQLQAISNELDALVEESGQEYLLAYLKNPGGTFKWRTIAGTDRLSLHSFGMAMDINAVNSDYWEWAKGGAAVYKNRIPLAIVNIFEKHGFIWGGKWYHFDTMHFEYRPELLPPS